MASDTVWANGREQQHSVEYGKVVVQRMSSVNRRSVLSEYAAGQPLGHCETILAMGAARVQLAPNLFCNQ